MTLVKSAVVAGQTLLSVAAIFGAFVPAFELGQRVIVTAIPFVEAGL